MLSFVLEIPANNKPTNLEVEQRLQLDNQLPVVVGHVLAVELLERVDTLTRDHTVELVVLLQLATVGGLGAAHLDLDGHRGLALFTHRDLLVLSLDTRSIVHLLVLADSPGWWGLLTLYPCQ